MADAPPDILIAGGGLAGSLVALAMAERRADVRILLVEQGPSFGGQHVWSFFDTDVDPACHSLLDPLVTRRWPDHDIAFPARRRTLGIGYNSVRSSQLDSVVKDRLEPASIRLNFEISTVGTDYVIGSDGERIAADVVLDARGAWSMPSFDLGWQKFVGRTYRFKRPHGRVRPMIMDATVQQQDGYRFIYVLPFSEREALIEDTYYSDGPALDVDHLGGGLEAVAASLGEASCLDEEKGVLPVVMSGDIADLWKDTPAPPIGVRGGFFHPTTGYSLPDAARVALLLSEQRDLSGPALRAVLRREAQQFWDSRRFFQLLNRMLFRGSSTADRYRVLEHFYRLPEPTIGRFYAGRLNLLDKLRILSGKPPVPIGRALRAVRKQSA